jgi:hypothetical protein
MLSGDNMLHVRQWCSVADFQAVQLFSGSSILAVRTFDCSVLTCWQPAVLLFSASMLPAIQSSCSVVAWVLARHCSCLVVPRSWPRSTGVRW